MIKIYRVHVGLAIHVLVATVMVFSAIVKCFELIGSGNPPEQGGKYVLPLAMAELANALLLLIPRTMSIGILIASAGWGAVTAFALMQADDVVAPISSLVPIAFLVLTWIGGYLRDTRMLYYASAERVLRRKARLVAHYPLSLPNYSLSIRRRVSGFRIMVARRESQRIV